MAVCYAVLCAGGGWLGGGGGGVSVLSCVLHLTCGEPVCTTISDCLLPLTVDTCLSKMLIYQKGETIVAMSANKKSKRENS